MGNQPLAYVGSCLRNACVHWISMRRAAPDDGPTFLGDGDGQAWLARAHHARLPGTLSSRSLPGTKRSAARTTSFLAAVAFCTICPFVWPCSTAMCSIMTGIIGDRVPASGPTAPTRGWQTLKPAAQAGTICHPTPTRGLCLSRWTARLNRCQVLRRLRRRTWLVLMPTMPPWKRFDCDVLAVATLAGEADGQDSFTITTNEL